MSTQFEVEEARERLLDRTTDDIRKNAGGRNFQLALSAVMYTSAGHLAFIQNSYGALVPLAFGSFFLYLAHYFNSKKIEAEHRFQKYLHADSKYLTRKLSPRSEKTE